MTTTTTARKRASAAPEQAPEAPAVPDSGTQAWPQPPRPEPSLTVEQAWTAVMGTVQGLKKAQRNAQQNFNFRGIDDVMNAVGPALREHGVSVVPHTVEVVATERYTSTGGANMKNVVIRVVWHVIGPAGDGFFGQSLGESADSGDKAVSKAHSVAYRTFLLQALCIPTDEPDPDAQSHVAAASPPASTAQQARETAGETLSFDGKAGYDRLKEILAIPDQSDRIKAVAEWNDRAAEKGVLEEKVIHGGRLRTLASIASEAASNRSATQGDSA